MQTHDHKSEFLKAFIVPLYILLVIWAVYAWDVHSIARLTTWGIYPRTLNGLVGIFFSPFLHGSLEHLWNNTLPFLVLGSALFYFYKSLSLKVLIWSWLLSGLLTWLIARPAYHIGASGVIYALVSFLFFKGVMARNYRLMALSLLVVFLYGSMVWYMLPVRDGLSWEGHVSGFLTGILLAWRYKVRTPAVPKYEWERADYDPSSDPFMRQFDENGNFQPLTSEEETEQWDVTYHFRENKED